MRDRPGRRQALCQGGFGFLRKQQPAQAACRIGERGGDRVMAVEPYRAARLVSAARTRAGMFRALLRRAAEF